MNKDQEKAKAPFLALAYNLVFNLTVKNSFNENPSKVLMAFGIPEQDIHTFISDKPENFLEDKIAKELATLSSPQIIIPHSTVFRKTPVLSFMDTVLQNGTISDLYQPDNDTYRNNLFEVFGVDTENKPLIEALETVIPGVDVISENIHKELDEWVQADLLNTK
jgi:hypothetical protein